MDTVYVWEGNILMHNVGYWKAGFQSFFKTVMLSNQRLLTEVNKKLNQAAGEICVYIEPAFQLLHSW